MKFVQAIVSLYNELNKQNYIYLQLFRPSAILNGKKWFAFACLV